MKVWFELVDNDGKPHANTTTTNIKIDKNETLDVADFCKVVCKQLGTILAGILPQQLLAYSNKDAFNNRERESPMEV
jgi:hypothetical protein